MQNFDSAIRATETAFNSQGSAMRENAKAMESLEAQTNLLRAEWEDFANNVISSEMVSFFLSLGEGALKVINTDLGQTVTQVVLITGALTGLWGILKPMMGGVTAFIATNPWVLGVAGVTALTTAIIKYMKAQDALIQDAKELRDAMEDSNKTFNESEITINATADVASDYIDRIEELTSKSKLTEQEQYNLERTIEELNSLYPQLGLSIDNTTGKLNKQTNEIRDLVDQYKQLALQQAITTRLESQASAVAEARLDLREAEYQKEKIGANVEKAINIARYQYGVSADKTDDFVLDMIMSQMYGQGFTSLPTGIQDLFGDKRALVDAINQYDDIRKTIKELENQLAQAEATYQQSVSVYSDLLIGKQTQDAEDAFWKEYWAEYNKQFGMTEGTEPKSLKEREEEAEQARNSFKSLQQYYHNQLLLGQFTEEQYYETVYALAQKYFEGQDALLTEWAEQYDTYQKWKKKQDEQVLKDQEAADKAALKEKQNAYQADLDLYAHRYAMGEYGEGLAGESLYRRDIYERGHRAFEEGVIDAEVFKKISWEYEEYLKQLDEDMAEEATRIATKTAEAIAEATEKANKERIDSAKQAYSELFDFIDQQTEHYNILLQANQDAQEVINQNYNDELAALEATNSALEDEIAYQEKLNNLAKAKSEKLLVWKDGRFQQVENIQKVADATAELAKADRERALAAQREDIEERRQNALAPLLAEAEGIQDVINMWESYNDTLREVTTTISELGDASLALTLVTDFAIAKNDKERQEAINNFIGGYAIAHPSMYSFNGGYASGTTNSTNGLHLFGEKGAELGIIGSHNGVLPADITSNLWSWGSMTPSSFLASLIGNNGGMSVSIGSAQFPNVHNGADAEDFITSLRNLAYQAARSRIRS